MAITDQVFEVTGGVLIAKDAKRLKEKSAKFIIQGDVIRVSDVYVQVIFMNLQVRITNPAGKIFFKSGMVVRVPPEYRRLLN